MTCIYLLPDNLRAPLVASRGRGVTYSEVKSHLGGRCQSSWGSLSAQTPLRTAGSHRPLPWECSPGRGQAPPWPACTQPGVTKDGQVRGAVWEQGVGSYGRVTGASKCAGNVGGALLDTEKSRMQVRGVEIWITDDPRVGGCLGVLSRTCAGRHAGTPAISWTPYTPSVSQLCSTFTWPQ